MSAGPLVVNLQMIQIRTQNFKFYLLINNIWQGNIKICWLVMWQVLHQLTFGIDNCVATLQVTGKIMQTNLAKVVSPWWKITTTWLTRSGPLADQQRKTISCWSWTWHTQVKSGSDLEFQENTFIDSRISGNLII